MTGRINATCLPYPESLSLLLYLHYTIHFMHKIDSSLTMDTVSKCITQIYALVVLKMTSNGLLFFLVFWEELLASKDFLTTGKPGMFLIMRILQHYSDHEFESCFSKH